MQGDNNNFLRNCVACNNIYCSFFFLGGKGISIKIYYINKSIKVCIYIAFLGIGAYFKYIYIYIYKITQVRGITNENK